jgi:hypothetical protein
MESGPIPYVILQEEWCEMDILLRGVDPMAIKKIDELALQQNVSPSRYLINMIQNFTALEEFKNFDDRDIAMLEKNLLLIEKNTDTWCEIDILLRVVGNTAIKKIDKLALQQNVSRSRYLINMMQNFTALKEFKNFEDWYLAMLDMLEKTLLIIEKNTDMQQKILDIVKESNET